MDGFGDGKLMFAAGRDCIATGDDDSMTGAILVTYER